jgi:hypothetical protein
MLLAKSGCQEHEQKKFFQCREPELKVTLKQSELCSYGRECEVTDSYLCHLPPHLVMSEAAAL